MTIMDKTMIMEAIKEEIMAMQVVEDEDVDESTNFLKIGLSSVQALKVINKLRKKLNKEINPAVIFEYKTVGEIAEYLAS